MSQAMPFRDVQAKAFRILDRRQLDFMADHIAANGRFDVAKLSAYARRNKTRRALWEYDHILRSLYLLNYVDSPPLRRNVQRALNRGENYHRLRRAVSYANFGKLGFKTDQEEHVWGECARLLTNCMIYCNATLLSHLWEHKAHSGDLQGATLLSRVSPVAWQYINVYKV
jgi:hypothetical protein